MPLSEAVKDVVDPTALDYVIAAETSHIEITPRSLKSEDTFAVFDAHGDAAPELGGNLGLFHRDTRHLSKLFLSFCNVRPLLLSSTVREDNATFTCDMTNPHLAARDGSADLQHSLIHLRRQRFLFGAACHDCLTLHNFDVAPRDIEIAFDFSADFADLFEVRGARRARKGEFHAPRVAQDSVALAYTGLDGRTRRTVLQFEPRPSELSGERALYRIALGPGETLGLYIEISCEARDGGRSARQAFRSALHSARARLRERNARAAVATSSNQYFNDGLHRAASDLAILVTDTPEGAYPYAGVPWFSTVFGRDALITAFQTLWMDPTIARGVLLHLAANQAKDFDAVADAEPGKILHEVRYGEMAELGEVPFRRYYGSVDSTPLFVMLAASYFERTGDVETVRALWSSLKAALDWIAVHGDRDGDGFVEYHRQTDEGLANQGWKDSHDSISHEDGSLAKGPIALVEVQAYVYAAWLGAARLARALGLDREAAAHEARAGVLRDRFDAAFFDAGLGTYVLALDGEKRPCRVRSSNAGHALFTGVARPERAGRVVEALMSTASFSGWGVRTLSAESARYNPMSYHNGSVWPHDNSLIAMGFARYGFKAEALRIFEGLFRASISFDLRRLPELFCGFPRARNLGPVSYPVACAPQAWASAAPFALMQAALGLGFDVGRGRVTFDRPSLPDFLDELVIRHISLRDGVLDLKILRAGASAAFSVLSRVGDVGLIVEKP
ncbi:glycogen debranching enzyme [Rhodoblastus acidophilus]|uniref:amylo-alpha-1,6-glucosidase n=1 Tax=Rhodoblastus acidophilus TaxID=1074 RepID=UPI002224B279|nr:amylo-alpha-1,6-glucosidase [Rhodoblastus acidophilus]MCW2285335.1 glycogen debranching enzyme [Rhodoblastus acidophilus]MCW2334291.1 glycogen debranching enzyme [Rhodoblastus acidophilus]